MKQARSGASLTELTVQAVWAGYLFGLIEGIVLVLTRLLPTINAAHKVSPDILWIASLTSIVFASGVALALWLAGRTILVRRGLPARAAVACFTFLGSLAVLAGPGVLHWSGTLLLAAGLMVVSVRLVGDRVQAVTRWCRRYVFVVPLLVVLTALGVSGERTLRERRMAGALSSADTERPNVLVLMLDTVRRDRVLAGGGARLTSTLEAFGRTGITYRNAWANSSWSLPSQATALTGRLPGDHGGDWPRLEIDDSVPTLAELFRTAGYSTGAFSSNISWVTPEYVGRGFMRFTVYTIDNLWRRTVSGQLIASALSVAVGERRNGRSFSADRTNDQLLRFIDDYPDKPFFAYVCYMDVNRAFYGARAPGAVWASRPTMDGAIAAYDAGLEELDADIGRLLTELDRRGILRNTIIVITSDHGESFGEEKGDRDPEGHGTSLYPEQVRIPMWISGPGMDGEVSVDQAVDLASIARTVLELAGLSADPAMEPGLPLAPTGLPGNVQATLDYDRFSARAVVDGLLEYIRHPAGAAVRSELFDLAVDPRARNNLAPGHPDAARLDRAIESSFPRY